MAGRGRKKYVKLRKTKKATAKAYFNAVKRGNKKAMAWIARKDSLEQLGYW